MKCRTCKAEKPLTAFFRNKTYSCGYNTQCKQCAKEYYAERNKDPEVKAANNARHRAWAEKNKGKSLAIKKRYRDSNREKMLAYARQWSKENRGTKNANWQRYRARKKQATVWNDPAIDYVYCAADVIKGVYGGRPDVDHIIPLKHDLVSGLHVAQNLQLMNPSANYSKGNTWLP